MEYVIGFMVWYAVGFIAFAWSMDWDIKDSIWLCIGVSFTGPLCLLQAIKVKNM